MIVKVRSIAFRRYQIKIKELSGVGDMDESSIQEISGPAERSSGGFNFAVMSCKP